MRLHRHDELVEAMARAMFDVCRETMGEWEDTAHLWIEEATAALDALLEAAVRLGVGWRNIRPVEEGYTLILRMEANDD